MASPPPPGFYVPAVLFLQENEDLDVPSITAHVLRLAKGGVTGIVIQGSNGEASHLTREERKRTIAIARQTLDDNGFGNVIIIAGTGTQSARETIDFCIDAEDAGASHALVISPSTWPAQMTPDNVIRFHRRVADASPIPVMIYNFPMVTAGLDLDSDTIAALAQHPNIVGTKLSCGSLGKLHRLASTFPTSEFATFSGKSEIFLQALLSGGAGCIAALVNVVPKLHSRLYTLYKEGRSEDAMKLQAKLGHGEWACQKIGGIGGIKAIVSQNFGYGGRMVRCPLKPVEIDELRNNKHYQTILDLIAIEQAL
ncbi:aldolase [Fistulina hepatica ATCC 64428]|nr:aldolase [Fistulina hepatica ATCC 64428]